MIASFETTRRPRHRQPAWDIARLYPDQGAWDEDDYLALETNHLVEFTDGFVEVLPMPTTSHQRIVLFIYALLKSFAGERELGEAMVAPLRVRLRAGKYREPDLIFMRTEHFGRIFEEYWDRPDLVMEVVSADPKSRVRDLRRKRREYAEAGIAEYWIIDPQLKQIVVLRLSGKRYVVHGTFKAGQGAASWLVKGFEVAVTDALGAGRI